MTKSIDISNRGDDNLIFAGTRAPGRNMHVNMDQIERNKQLGIHSGEAAIINKEYS